jgi:hypothetical protein
MAPALLSRRSEFDGWRLWRETRTPIPAQLRADFYILKMQSYHPTRYRVPSFIHRIGRVFRAAALGSLGALALGTMVQPAQAVVDLAHYKLSWEGSNGYSLTGTLSVDKSITTPTIDASQLWDMSVSFYGPGNQLLSTWTEMEDGHQVYDYLTFSFDRQELWVNQYSIDIGWDTGQYPNEFFLYNSEVLSLYSVSLGNFVSYGGTVFITADGEVIPSNTAPTLNIPTSPLVVEANSPGGAQVFFNVSASDLEDEMAPVATSNPQSGSFFNVGDTVVNVSATDSGGLSTEGSFTVRVQDTTAPQIYLSGCSADFSVALGSEFSAPGASAYDTVNAWVAVNVTGSVDTNTIGNYTLTYTASDEKGNTSSVTRTVSVVDPMPNVNNRQYSGGNAFGHGDFKITAKGNVTAALSVNGQNYRTLFTLSKRNQAVTFRGLKNATIPANVFVDVNGHGEPVLIVSTEATTLELKAARYSITQPAPANVAGTYTAVFRGNDWELEPLQNVAVPQHAPMGVGFATITVARDGRVRTVGRTAEGAALSASSHLVRPPCGNEGGEVFALASTSASTSEGSEASQFHVYTGLYKTTARGNLSGEFTLDRSNEAGSLSGEFHWEAPEGALSLYPQGFEVWGPIVGSRYEQSLPGPINLRFDFEEQESITGSGSVAVWPVIFDVANAGKGRPLGLRCRFNDRTGEFNGAGYRGSAARSFKAVWLQEQGTIQGFSVAGDGLSHGYVELEEVVVEIPPIDPILPPAI